MDERVRARSETLAGVLNDAFALLARHAADPDNHVVLATAVNGEPDARTVVLRRFDDAARTLLINTDRRSPKKDELAHSTHAVVVLYDAHARTQLRVQANVRVHYDDAMTREQWAALPFAGRRLYMTLAPPGAIASAPTSGVAPGFEQRAPDAPDDAAGYSHFCVLELAITGLDWLHFGRDGSRRAAFAWDAQGRMQAHWLYP